MPDRAVLYVDGFNLYYGIESMNRPHLKWLDLNALGAFLSKQYGHEFAGTVFCTALNDKHRTSNPDRLNRHRTYIRALEHHGVEVVKGHFIEVPRDCHNCNHAWTESNEKETDINLSISVIRDCYDATKTIDHIYLLTADSDQAATAKFVRTQFPNKKIKSIVPPNKELSRNIYSYADGKYLLTENDLEKCLFPVSIISAGGIIRRPTQYDPPAGWVAPSLRKSAKQHGSLP